MSEGVDSVIEEVRKSSSMKLIDFSKLKKQEELDDSEDYKPKARQSVQSKIKGLKTGSIDTKQMVLALVQYFKSHRVQINNSYCFNNDYENDFVTLFESGYIAEIEVKISKSDFMDDLSGKKGKHGMMVEGKEWKKIPNKFFYAVPRGLLLTSQIPSYAGLIEVSKIDDRYSCEVVKDAPFLHKNDVYKEVKDRIFRKLAWRYRQMLLGNFDMLFEDVGEDVVAFEEV